MSANTKFMAQSSTLPRAAYRFSPATFWIAVGALIFLLEAYSLTNWALSDRFVATNPGTDIIPPGDLLRLRIMEACSAAGFVLLIGLVLVRPWLRDGRPSFDGLLIVSWLLVLWQDPMVNYISTQYLINSHLINFGSWTLGSTPGWISPRGNQLPEPAVLYPAVYMLFGLVPSVVLCAAWRRYREWRPQASFIGYALIGFAIGIMLDLLAEGLMIRGGVFAYPNAVRSLSLWPGELHQFPLYEACFVSILMNACGYLRFTINDRGETVAERGIEQMRLKRTRTLARFLAIYGFVQLGMIVLYDIPLQWFSLHTDSFVEGYPSYMVNGLCASGADGATCPGKGVPMPRN